MLTENDQRQEISLADTELEKYRSDIRTMNTHIFAINAILPALLSVNALLQEDMILPPNQRKGYQANFTD